MAKTGFDDRGFGIVEKITCEYLRTIRFFINETLCKVIMNLLKFDAFLHLR